MTLVTRTGPPSPSRLLAHVLERPELVRAVRDLPAEGLSALLERVGLEDAGELVALATTEQLERVFDDDLWTADAAGSDPAFDAKRFNLWLEVLLEAGEDAVVRRFVELPFDFVTLAVHRSMLVVDLDALALEVSDGSEETEWLEKALESSLHEEWEEFRLIARDASVWDSLLSVLFALDRDHHELLRRVLERCAALSSEHIADNGGLYEVLTSDEMLEVDARAARDERRAERGYIAPSDAKSFLELARRGLGDDGVRDPMTRAYFRELGSRRPARPTPARGERQAAVERLMKLLVEANVVEPPPALPERTGHKQRAKRAKSIAIVPSSAPREALERALAELRETDAVLYAERMEEVAYLANVLVAAHAPGGRRLRPIEAVELAMRTCTLGLERRLRIATGGADDRAADVVRQTHLDELFRTGWRGT